MGNPGRQVASLPRSCHMPWNLPNQALNPHDATSCQLEGLPQIPQKHYARRIDRVSPHNKASRSSAQRFLKRAETLFAIAQGLCSSKSHERAQYREKLEYMLSADGHTLFEYHATFVLRAEMESVSEGRDWALQLMTLWQSLPKHSKEWWRAHTEEMLRALGGEHDLAVPRNFQTGDTTKLARAYAYRIKAALHRQKIDIPEQRPGWTLDGAAGHLVSQDARCQVSAINTCSSASSLNRRGRDPRKRPVPVPGAFEARSPNAPTAPTKRSKYPVLEHLLWQSQCSISSPLDTLRDQLLQTISDILREEPNLQTHCRGSGVRIVYQPDFFGVTGIAIRLRTAVFQAKEDRCKTCAVFEALLRPFVLCNLTASAFAFMHPKPNYDQTYIADDDSSCLAWLNGKVDIIALRGDKAVIVSALMDALYQHVTHISNSSTLPLCFQAQQIVDEVRHNISSYGKFSVVRNSLGFEEQLLRCFDPPGLRPAKYEDLLEQRFYALQQHTRCDFMLDRMVEV